MIHFRISWNVVYHGLSRELETKLLFFCKCAQSIATSHELTMNVNDNLDSDYELL